MRENAIISQWLIIINENAIMKGNNNIIKLAAAEINNEIIIM